MKNVEFYIIFSIWLELKKWICKKKLDQFRISGISKNFPKIADGIQILRVSKMLMSLNVEFLKYYKKNIRKNRVLQCTEVPRYANWSRISSLFFKRDFLPRDFSLQLSQSYFLLHLPLCLGKGTQNSNL